MDRHVEHARSMKITAAAWSVLALVWMGVVIRYVFLVPRLPGRAADWNFDLYYVLGAGDG